MLVNVMRLYNANFSPNALRVRAVAHELGVELEIVEVDIRAGDNRAAEFLARNPNAKVPVVALPLNLRRDAFGIEFCP